MMPQGPEPEIMPEAGLPAPRRGGPVTQKFEGYVIRSYELDQAYSFLLTPKEVASYIRNLHRCAKRLGVKVATRTRHEGEEKIRLYFEAKPYETAQEDSP